MCVLYWNLQIFYAQASQLDIFSQGKVTAFKIRLNEGCDLTALLHLSLGSEALEPVAASLITFISCNMRPPSFKNFKSAAIWWSLIWRTEHSFHVHTEYSATVSTCWSQALVERENRQKLKETGIKMKSVATANISVSPAQMIRAFSCFWQSANNMGADNPQQA